MNYAVSTGKIDDFLTNVGGAGGSHLLGRERPAMTLPTSRGANQQHLDGGDCMAPVADTPQGGTTQRFIDPLILHARFLNEAAALDRALAMRKALRPQRPGAATRGWETRRGL